jgi:hypothetical protein
LKDIDPQHRSTAWQYTNVMVFCTVHFKKGVDQAAGTNENLIIRKTILSLLDATNRNHYFDILDAIKDKKY